jgi:hypothetical protein
VHGQTNFCRELCLPMLEELRAAQRLDLKIGLNAAEARPAVP